MGGETLEAETRELARETRICPLCGQRFGADARFCPFDGETLEAGPSIPPPDPLIGAIVDGRYEVEALLGEGGMGRVYRVRHIALERYFAMKVLKGELASDGELAARFVREARAAASIHHPHVVAITDFGQLYPGAIVGTTQESPYFVMEFLVGQTLAQLIRWEGPLPAARAVRILAQVADAVGAAHEAGIVHRDLKPDNIFLVGRKDMPARTEDVRVLDFGAAQVIGNSRLTKKGVVFGTPHYMSPEQAQGHSVDPRSDVYALGVIMYEMFTGRVPFEGDTYMGVLTQHMFAEPPPPSAVTREARELGALEAIILRALAKTPEQRFPTARALASEIGRAVQIADDGAVTIAPATSVAFPVRDSRAPRASLPSYASQPRLDSRPSMPSPWPTAPRIPRAAIGVVAAAFVAGGALAVVASRPPGETRRGAEENATTASAPPSAATPPAPLAPPAPQVVMPAEVESTPKVAARRPGARAAPSTPPAHAPAAAGSTAASATPPSRPPSAQPTPADTDLADPWSK